ncbi:MAG: DUF1778 domain-containing protein [Planctomycetia bacterium]|nr:DUF1778 domain-containing protein [Planctomycetia bacterium]
MSTEAGNDARLNFRLSGNVKALIAEAASTVGQSLTEFAVASLVRSAREVIQEDLQTRLTNRDRTRFISLLDAVDARPNKALKTAARRYKRRLG